MSSVSAHLPAASFPRGKTHKAVVHERNLLCQRMPPKPLLCEAEFLSLENRKEPGTEEKFLHKGRNILHGRKLFLKQRKYKTWQRKYKNIEIMKVHDMAAQAKPLTLLGPLLP